MCGGLPLAMYGVGQAVRVLQYYLDVRNQERRTMLYIIRQWMGHGKGDVDYTRDTEI